MRPHVESRESRARAVVIEHLGIHRSDRYPTPVDGTAAVATSIRPGSGNVMARERPDRPVLICPPSTSAAARHEQPSPNGLLGIHTGTRHAPPVNPLGDLFKPGVALARHVCSVKIVAKPATPIDQGKQMNDPRFVPARHRIRTT